MKLENLYTVYYQKPFVLLAVSNRRVVVFPGGGGDAKIVPLEKNNTTMLEVLASAGGLASRGDAHRVKLFRRDSDGGRKVFQFDLSDIDNLKYADMVMQADDVIYVQPNAEIARGLLQQITPLIALLTTTILGDRHSKVVLTGPGMLNDDVSNNAAQLDSYRERITNFSNEFDLGLFIYIVRRSLIWIGMCLLWLSAQHISICVIRRPLMPAASCSSWGKAIMRKWC
jgi:hypothetical protein